VFASVSTPVLDNDASPCRITAAAALVLSPTYILPLSSELESLLLKVDQSVLDSLPVLVDEATGILIVCVSTRDTTFTSEPLVPVTIFCDDDDKLLIDEIVIPFTETHDNVPVPSVVNTFPELPLPVGNINV
jgi:hypothetical protein